MIGFANSDGGCIAVGIYAGQVEGVSSAGDRINDLLQAAIRFTCPPVRYAYRFIECKNKQGNQDKVLVFDIEASETIHRNVKNECYLRVGDENRKLGPTEERELAFDKGESWFDGSIVRDLTLDDLNLREIDIYRQRVGSSEIDTLMRARGLYVDRRGIRGVTQAGWLLFGNEPPTTWSYVRYLRYAGITAETGPRSNLTQDIRLEGTLPFLIEKAKALVAEKLGTVDRLLSSGRFERVSPLPEFAWLEAIVNAVTHRSYSLQGDGIRIKHFDDRLEVESPGRLPGLVRVQNIRNTRFSRNPRIARVLAELGYVRELNEGVRRMYEEMERYGLRDPQYTATQGGVLVSLFMQPDKRRAFILASNVLSEKERQVIEDIGRIIYSSMGLLVVSRRLNPEKVGAFLQAFAQQKQLLTHQAAALLGVSTKTARNYLKRLEAVGMVKQVQKSKHDPHGYWVINESFRKHRKPTR